MALGTRDADAQKDLRDRAANFSGVGIGFVKQPGRRFGQQPLRTDEFPHEFVVRFVLGKAVANPGVIVVGLFQAERTAINAEQIGPPQGPVFGVFGTPQQRFDDLLPPVGSPVCQKIANLVGGRQGSDHVEVDPSQIFFIAAKRRGDDIQSLELRVDQGIDEIVLRQLLRLLELPVRGGQLERNKCPKNVDSTHVGRHHGRFTGVFAGRYEPEIVHLDQFIVVGLELGVAGHVDFVPIAIAGNHAQLLRLVRTHLPFARRDLNGNNVRSGRVAFGCSRRDPIAKQAIFGRGLLNPQPAAVWNARRSLFEDEAFFRSGRENPPPTPFFQQGQPIGVGIETEDRQLEPVLPLGLPVTAGRIAAEAAQNGQNIVLEVQRAWSM